MRLLDVAMSQAWAITPDALRVILDITERQEVSPAVIEAVMHGTPEAVAAKVGRPLDNTQTAEVRDGIAVIPVIGPIFRFANLFTEVSGATSVQVLARDLTTALDDPKVSGILLHVDSPGGEASGIAELADMIRAGTERKPITAYVSDLGASAGYWLASSAGRVVAAETALLGSIGVVMATRDPRRDKGKDIEFVSSVSPNKRPDPTTPSGQDQYQALVDQLGDIFVAAVARNRGVKPQAVLDDFGAGGLLVGAQAVEAGLADALGSFEGTLAEMQAKHRRAEQSAARKQHRAAAQAVAPITTSARPARPGGRMGMRERFFAWLDGMDVEASAGDTEQEGRPMGEQRTDTGQRPAPTPIAASEPQVSDEVLRLRAEVNRKTAEAEAAKAESLRYRNERIAAEAVAFADAAVRDEKARPAEREAIIAAYTQAALDDAVLTDGAGRVKAIEALYGARPQGTLTREELHPAALQILTQRERTAADKDAPPSAARLEELLGKTALGATVLNGKGH
jgi:ClpP class serine protease